VLDSPLGQYGEFDWYCPNMETLPDRFSVVTCDGPPGDTLGGRYGLVPVMHHHLRSGSVILLDDAEREHEQEVAKRWEAELPAKAIWIDGRKPFIRLVVD
jgi:hypothetical protein